MTSYLYLIGGKGQLVRSRDGMIHAVTKMTTGGFVPTTTCGILWRIYTEFAPDDAVIDCMTCLVRGAHE